MAVAWLFFCRIECGRGPKKVILMRNFLKNSYLMRHNAAIRHLTETLACAALLSP
jgi:hypothetical protein